MQLKLAVALLRYDTRVVVLVMVSLKVVDGEK